jgi:membrane-associated PAP2 superfamily phosphatase
MIITSIHYMCIKSYAITTGLRAREILRLLCFPADTASAGSAVLCLRVALDPERRTNELGGMM